MSLSKGLLNHLFNRQRFYLEFLTSKSSPKKNWQEYGIIAQMILSDANNYIKTNIKSGYITGKTELRAMSTNGLGTRGIYGFIDRSNIADRINAGITSAGWFVGSGGATAIGSIVDGEVVDIVWDRKTQKASLNGVERTVVPATTSGKVFNNYIFARNNGSDLPDAPYYWRGGLSSLKEYDDDGNLILDLVPIKLTKKPYSSQPLNSFILWDLVTDTALEHIGEFNGLSTSIFKAESYEGSKLNIGGTVVSVNNSELSLVGTPTRTYSIMNIVDMNLEDGKNYRFTTNSIGTNPRMAIALRNTYEDGTNETIIQAWQSSLTGNTFTYSKSKPIKNMQFIVEGLTTGIAYDCKVQLNLEETVNYNDYEELEYIESTGTQYIDTELDITNWDNVEFAISLNQETTSNNAIFGARASSGASQIASANIFVLNNKFRLDWLYATIFSGDLSKDTIYNLKLEKGKIIVNGTEYFETIATSGQSQGNAYIGNFYDENKSGVHGTGLSGKIYKYVRRDPDTLEIVQNFIPCKMKATGQVGMWDLISEKFYGNSGTGEFYAPTDSAIINQLNLLGIESTGNVEQDKEELRNLGIEV